MVGRDGEITEEAGVFPLKEEQCSGKHTPDTMDIDCMPSRPLSAGSEEAI